MRVIVFIELLGIAQGGFLLLAWLRSPNRWGWAGRFLTGLLVVASSLLYWLALHDSRWLANVPDLIGLGPAVPFLFGPLLLGYLQAVVQPGFRWRNVYWLHSLPFWLILLGHFPFYEKPFAEKRAFVLNHYAQPHLDWWGWLPLLSFLTYVPALFKIISQHDAALKNQFSTIETRRLAWLRQLLLGVGLCYGLFSAGYLVQGLHPAGGLLAFALTGLVYIIGYRQLRHPVLFEPSTIPNPDLVLAGETHPPPPARPELPTRRKYEKSELPADQSRIYADQLDQLMQVREPYRNGRLTLTQLADELGTTPHALSQVLNQTLDVSFYDYVNGYRVEAVKRALADSSKHHLTILALAIDAGFESKAAFNNAFKKHVGLTPSQYRHQLRTE